MTTVFTDTDPRTAYSEFHHKECGKVWTEAPDDALPSHCPGCGDELEEWISSKQHALNHGDF